jgi:hypothetical protein
MNDRHPTELLSAYLDGEVTTAERIQVERHLDQCEGCRALLGDFRTMASAAAQEPPPPVPAGMASRIVATLGTLPAERTRARRARPLFAWVPLPVAVAAGLLAALAGTWVLLRRQPDRQPVAVAQAERENLPPAQALSGDLAGMRHEVEAPVSQSRSGRSDRPGATPPPAATLPTTTTPPPAAAEARPERDAAPRFRSLDDRDRVRKQALAAVREPAANAAPSSKVAARASPDAPVVPPGAAPAPSTRALGRPAPSEPQAKVAPAVALETAGVTEYGPDRPETEGWSLVFEIEGTRGTLTETGLVTLVLDQGSCSVDLSAAPAAGDEVRSIFHLASATPAPRPSARADEAKEPGRFQESGAAAKRAAGGVVGEATGTPAGEAQEKRVETPVKLIRVLPRTSRPLDAAGIFQIEERLRRLLDVTARDFIESRCAGPPPQSRSGE